MSYSPIALFLYNRPVHTKKVLDALSENKEAKFSELFIFVDGIKDNASRVEMDKRNHLLNIIEKESRFKQVKIIFSKKNKGLATSIVDGINFVLSIYDRIIVLEDDILTQSGFLEFMNNALDYYKNNENVGCISGWSNNVISAFFHNKTYFLKGSDCWGWGTWKRAWSHYNQDGKFLLEKIIKNNLTYEFNRKAMFPFLGLLQDQVQQKNQSWAIRWHASLYLANKLCLYPVISLVENIGFDGSGVHKDEFVFSQKVQSKLKFYPIPALESKVFFISYRLRRILSEILKL